MIFFLVYFFGFPFWNTPAWAGPVVAGIPSGTPDAIAIPSPSMLLVQTGYNPITLGTSFTLDPNVISKGKNSGQSLLDLINITSSRFNVALATYFAGKAVEYLPGASNQISSSVTVELPIFDPAHAGCSQLIMDATSQSLPTQSCVFNCYCIMTDCSGIPAPIQCTVEPNSCAIERAMKRGAFVREVFGAYDSAMNELTTTGSLNLGPNCASPLKDNSFVSLDNAISQYLASWTQYNQGATLNCPDPSVSGNKPEQAECYLQAAMTKLVAVIGQSTVCEIFSRAETAWYTTVSNKIETTLSNLAQNDYTTCMQDTNDPGLVAACLNSLFAADATNYYLNYTASQGGPGSHHFAYLVDLIKKIQGLE